MTKKLSTILERIMSKPANPLIVIDEKSAITPEQRAEYIKAKRREREDMSQWAKAMQGELR